MHIHSMGGTGTVPSSMSEGSNTYKHIQTVLAWLNVQKKVKYFLQREEEMHFHPIS